MRIDFKVVCLFLCSVFSTSLGAEEVRPMRTVVRHIESGGIGYKQGYTTLEGFFSPIRPLNDTWVPFLDLRGHLFNNGQPAINAGVGVRYLASSRVWGTNAYYDYRKTNREHYNQIAAGFESLGERWDFRINGYLPVGKTKSAFWGSDFDHFHGHFAFLSGKRESALKGINAEAAAHLHAAKHVDVTMAIGPYYLAGHGNSTWGGEARVEIDLSQYCKLSGYTSYDSTFHWTGQGQISIVIPFGRKREIKTKNGQSLAIARTLAMRSIQPVDRFEIIPVHRKKSTAKAIDPFTGKPYFFWFVNNTSHSLGTFESPFPTLLEAQNVSATGDVIYVFPGDGTSTGMNEGFILKDRQLFLGAGIVHRLPTSTGTMSIPPQAVGLPSVTAPLGDSVITVANHNVISGFQIISDANGVTNGSYCIGSLSGATRDLFISRNVLTANNGATGIIPHDPSGDVIITDNIIQSEDSKGIYGINLSQTGGSSFYAIKNNVISNFLSTTIFLPDVPSGTGIAILAQNQSRVRAIVSKNQILRCAGNGIDLRAFGTGSPTFSAVVSQNQIKGGLPVEERGIYLFSNDSAIATFQLLNNEINESIFGIFAQVEGISSMIGWIQNNILSSGPLGSGIAIETNRLTPTGAARGVFSVIANDVSRYGDAQGVATTARGASSLTAWIANNEIFEIGKAGVFSQGFQSSNSQLTIIGNNIHNNNGGMEIDAFDQATVNVVMQGNLITQNNGAALFAHSVMNSLTKYEILANTFMHNNLMSLNSGSALTMITEGAATLCLRMQNNQSSMEATQPDYFLENLGSGPFSVEPLVGNTGTLVQSGTTPVPTGFCNP